MKWKQRANGYSLYDNAGVCHGVIFKTGRKPIHKWCWEQRIPDQLVTVCIGFTRHMALARTKLIARVVEARLEA